MIAYVPDYRKTMTIEAKGHAMFNELVVSRLEDYHFTEVKDNCKHGMTLQKCGLDYLCTAPQFYPRRVGIELKTELINKHKNFFLEHEQDITAHEVGWLHSCTAQLLCYSFLTPEPIIYVLNLDEVRMFLYEGKRHTSYPIKIQGKYDLPSRSSGLCLPIQHCRDYLKHFHEITRETPPDALRAAFSMAIHE